MEGGIVVLFQGRRNSTLCPAGIALHQSALRNQLDLRPPRLDNSQRRIGPRQPAPDDEDIRLKWKFFTRNFFHRDSLQAPKVSFAPRPGSASSRIAGRPLVSYEHFACIVSMSASKVNRGKKRTDTDFTKNRGN